MASALRSIGRWPFYYWPASFATVCFIGTFATDLMYWRTADWFWADFSDWLVTSGVIVGGVALVVALIEIFATKSTPPPRWPYAIASVLALVLAFLNTLIHTRDAWTSVVPWGLALSALVVFLVLVAGVTARSPYSSNTPAGASIADRPLSRGVAGVVIMLLAFASALALKGANAAFDTTSQIGSLRAAPCGRSSMNATNSAPTSCRAI